MNEELQCLQLDSNQKWVCGCASTLKLLAKSTPPNRSFDKDFFNILPAPILPSSSHQSHLYLGRSRLRDHLIVHINITLGRRCYSWSPSLESYHFARRTLTSHNPNTRDPDHFRIKSGFSYTPLLIHIQTTIQTQIKSHSSKNFSFTR